MEQRVVSRKQAIHVVIENSFGLFYRGFSRTNSISENFKLRRENLESTFGQLNQYSYWDILIKKGLITQSKKCCGYFFNM